MNMKPWVYVLILGAAPAGKVSLAEEVVVPLGDTQGSYALSEMRTAEVDAGIALRRVDGAMIERGGVVTNVAAGQRTDAIRFAAAADQHYGLNNAPLPPYDDDTVEDWMHDPGLPELDFVVASFGDWIADFRELGAWQDLEYCWQIITEYNADHQKIPYFFVFGNHDITNYRYMPDDGNPVLKERLCRSICGLNENNYAFMYNNVLFICVAQTNVHYHLSHFQRSWVEYLVDRYHDKTTVLWTHQATYETTGQGDERATSWMTNDYRVHNNVEWWRSLFEDNPQIKLYIHGHTHKAYNTTAFDLHPEGWDDNCTFVLIPSNGFGEEYGQDAWSYIFTITDTNISIQLWDSSTHSYNTNVDAGVPYVREGVFNVTDSGLEWFSIPKRVLDGQQWSWKNRMMAKQYKLELVGSNVTEQIDNPELDGCHESDEDGGPRFEGYWYAVRGDEAALNTETGEEDEYIKIAGDNTVSLAASAPVEGHGEGLVPYNTAIAVPGKTYDFSARIKTAAGTGSVDFLVSIPEYLTLYTHVWEDERIYAGFAVTDEFVTFSETFTVPNDDAAWFIQPKIHFDDPAVTYIWDSWSLKMVGDGDVTEDFSVTLNDETHTASGLLEHHDYSTFTLSNTTMSNTLSFSCTIHGNKVGMVRLIYEEPQLWSDDVSIGIENSDQTLIYVEDVSPYNDRTSIMSFKDAEFSLDDPAFYHEVVRGKRTYFHDVNDAAINGYYSVGRLLGDCDDDGDVDLQDFFSFQTCFTGPGGYLDAGCECVDFDGDNDVDLADFLAFQTAYTGPG